MRLSNTKLREMIEAALWEADDDDADDYDHVESKELARIEAERSRLETEALPVLQRFADMLPFVTTIGAAYKLYSGEDEEIFDEPSDAAKHDTYGEDWRGVEPFLFISLGDMPARNYNECLIVVDVIRHEPIGSIQARLKLDDFGWEDSECTLDELRTIVDSGKLSSKISKFIASVIRSLPDLVNIKLDLDVDLS